MKRLPVVLLIVALVVAVSGCSAILDRAADEVSERIDDIAGQNGDVDEEPAETTDEEALVEGDFYSVGSIFDFGNYFKEVEYTFSEGDWENVYSYSLLGEETVSGVETTHMMIAYDEEVWELWVSGDQDIVRAVIDDQVFEGEQAEMLGFQFMALMAPFMMMMGWEEAFSDMEAMEYFGWRVVDQGTASRDLGAGNVPVSTFEIQVAGVDGTFSYEIADIQGRNFFIGWKIVEDGRTSEFKVTKLIPR